MSTQPKSHKRTIGFVIVCALLGYTVFRYLSQPEIRKKISARFEKIISDFQNYAEKNPLVVAPFFGLYPLVKAFWQSNEALTISNEDDTRPRG